jgi:hypothetical protein
VPRAVGHAEIVGPDAAGHVGDPDHLAGLERDKTLAHQVEIGDAVDFVVIGDARLAIAEADLGPHIELDLAAAGLGGATEGAAGGPAVARERPGDFAPALDTRPRRRAAGEARQHAERDCERGQQELAHFASPLSGSVPV